MSLSGKVIIITGAGSGIGAATAITLAALGASIVLTGRRVDPLANTAEKIRAAGTGQALEIAADTTKGADWKAVVEQTVAKFGKIDMLFANAGWFGTAKSIHESDDEDLRKLYDINVYGPTLALKYVGPELFKTGGVAVLNSSILASVPRTGTLDNLATYNATKSAVDTLVRGSTPIYAKHGARIFSVNPMIYETEMTGDNAGSFGFAFNPLGNAGHGSDFGAVLAALLTGTQYVNGDSISVVPSLTPGAPYTTNQSVYYQFVGSPTLTLNHVYASLPLSNAAGVPLPAAELANVHAQIAAHQEKVAAYYAAEGAKAAAH